MSQAVNLVQQVEHRMLLQEYGEWVVPQEAGETHITEDAEIPD